MSDNLIYVGCNIVSTHCEDTLHYKYVCLNSTSMPAPVYINCVLGTSVSLPRLLPQLALTRYILAPRLNSRQPQSEPRNGSERAGLIHLPSLAKRGNTSTGSDSVLVSARTLTSSARGSFHSSLAGRLKPDTLGRETPRRAPYQSSWGSYAGATTRARKSYSGSSVRDSVGAGHSLSPCVLVYLWG